MKGISPLIAAVLLIAFTVAIATLVAGWFSTLAGGTTEKVTNTTDLAVDCSAASINIKEVYVKAGLAGTVRVLVENNGFTDNLNISSAFAYNSTGNAFVATEVPVSDFDRGEIQILTFSDANMSTCPNNFDRVIVTTSCGGVSDTFSGTPKCE